MGADAPIPPLRIATPKKNIPAGSGAGHFVIAGMVGEWVGGDILF